MESIVNDKSFVRPAHEALNTDNVKKTEETEAESADRRMNEIANKAAGKGLQREHDDDRDIFTK
jgi:hypothetical protein